MRLALMAAWFVVIVAAVLPLVRRPLRRTRERGRLDELVKDPVCQTYVVRSRAVTRGAEGPYFCSAECASRYAGG